MSVLLEICNISKRFARSQRRALDEVSFDVRDGELLTLVGASGSGKTSLLRIIAGLETADSGLVRIRGEVLTHARDLLVPPESRRMGFVFQNHALFPHLTVEANVAFGLAKDSVQRDRVGEWLGLVGLADMAKRYPHELSGGERQRVALVRSLAPEPSLLLMDEPFSSLNLSLREELRDETRRVLGSRQATTVFVTHNADDALAVSDRIVVLSGGVVQQIGTPREIYRQPANRYVAASFGPCNFLPRSVLSNSVALKDRRGIEPQDCVAEEIWLRPQDLRLTRNGGHQASISGVVTETRFQGANQLATLECELGGDSIAIQVSLDGNLRAAAGDRLAIHPVSVGDNVV